MSPLTRVPLQCCYQFALCSVIQTRMIRWCRRSRGYTRRTGKSTMSWPASGHGSTLCDVAPREAAHQCPRWCPREEEWRSKGPFFCGGGEEELLDHNNNNWITTTTEWTTTQQQDQLRGNGWGWGMYSVGQQKKKKGRAEQSRVDIQNYYSNNNHIIINECNPRNINNDWVKENTRTERSSVAGRSNTINTLPHDHSL